MTSIAKPARGVAAVVGPLSLLLVPKCPLCILPLLAMLGIAAPAGLVVNGIVAAILLGWSILLFTTTTSLPLRASGLVPAVLLLAGWTYLAALAMIVIGFIVSRRCRERCARP